MKAAGCRLLQEPERETVMGFGRVMARLPHYFTLLARLAAHLEESRPDLVLLVDYPGLNLRIARIARSLRIPAAYFICPQYWAWAPWRIRKFSRRIDLALVIFPFEEAYFRDAGVHALYVGHPACDRTETDPIEDKGAAPLPDGRLLGLLPGSRRHELEMNLPVMLKAASLLRRRHPDLTPVLSHYDDGLLNTARRLASSLGVELTVLRGGMRRLAGSARLCLVGSGTATLEVAFSGTPMVVVYRTSKLFCRLAPHLLTVPHICQVNLLAGRELVPELLLGEDDPDPLVSLAVPLLEEGGTRGRMVEELAAFRERHFRQGALERAGEAILERYGL
jgi:lipid-A-disaccharide synthase